MLSKQAMSAQNADLMNLILSLLDTLNQEMYGEASPTFRPIRSEGQQYPRQEFICDQEINVKEFNRGISFALKALEASLKIAPLACDNQILSSVYSSIEGEVRKTAPPEAYPDYLKGLQHAQNIIDTFEASLQNSLAP